MSDEPLPRSVLHSRLALSSGAGSGAQNAIGISVLGGMIVGTLIGVFFIPLFFVVVQKVFGGRRKADPDAIPVAGGADA